MDQDAEEVMQKTAPLALMLMVLAACASSPAPTASRVPTVQPAVITPAPEASQPTRRQFPSGVQKDDVERLDEIYLRLEKIQEKIIELRGPHDSEMPY